MDVLGTYLALCSCGARCPIGERLTMGRPSSAICPLASSWAVSYTHLDVYKRQGLGSGEEEDGKEGLPSVSVTDRPA